MSADARPPRPDASLVAEALRFAREHKLYWITPIVVVLILVVLLLVTREASGPFIYTLF
jgi:hypothetical protein